MKSEHNQNGNGNVNVMVTLREDALKDIEFLCQTEDWMVEQSMRKEDVILLGISMAICDYAEEARNQLLNKMLSTECPEENIELAKQLTTCLDILHRRTMCDH